MKTNGRRMEAGTVSDMEDNGRRMEAGPVNPMENASRRTGAGTVNPMENTSRRTEAGTVSAMENDGRRTEEAAFAMRDPQSEDAPPRAQVAASQPPHDAPHEPTRGRSDEPLFTPGFAAIAIAQAFSLLGMEILQFVLPLHLLNLTGSGTLYGTVLAAGFIPYTLLAPIGGVVADRTRKRGVMAALDALLALVMAAYLACSGSDALVAITVAVLMFAFAAQALYQPCVQSAVPHVVAPARLEQAVAVTNQLSMVTGIGGPVVGGLVFGFCGLAPIAAVSAACFAASSLLVLAIVRVPYDPPARTAGLLATARADLSEALRHLRSHPIMWQTILGATLVNLFGSSFINVGSPYIVTESLGLSNQLMGVLQGALAVGGLAGGALVATRPGSFGIRSVPRLLVGVAAGLAAMAVLLTLPLPPLGIYAGMLAIYLGTMACCMAMSIAATSYLQMESPGTLVGKVMALTLMLANFATPLGQIAYGAAFDRVEPWLVAALAALAVALVTAHLARVYRREHSR